MSQSCNLYLSPKWTAREIMEVVKRVSGKDAEFRSTHEADYTRITAKEGEFDISCFFNSSTPVGTFTHLMRGAQGVELFRQIAGVLGGLLEASDYEGTLEFIDGKVNEHNDLPYHLRYAIVTDGIGPDDIDALRDSIQEWDKRIKASTRV